MIPKVSIIVPCYGVEKYLNRCLESLVSQTLNDIEIILVDDGSPDNVPKMCEEWVKRDSRIKAFHKENAGLGFARNSGLELASGEFVAFVDSDDYIELDAYEILYNVAKEKKADVVYCGMKKEISPNKFSYMRKTLIYQEFVDDNVKKIIPDFVASEPFCRVERKYDMSVCLAIYKTSIIKDYELRFVSERKVASEDLVFQIEFLEHAKKVSFIPDVLYHYCYNGESLTKNFSREKFERMKALYFLLKDKCKFYDSNGLRTKRMFIGNIRGFVRNLVNSKQPLREKKKLISDILNDDIWDEVKTYRASFLPLHQRIFSFLFFHRFTNLVYIYAKLFELKKYF